jgi:hypothetical protein
MEATLEKDMLQSIKKTLDKVRFVLQAHPDTRNNDNLLCQVYWREVDGVQDLEGVQFATSAEAIRRSRQLLNERNILIATDLEILKKRKQKAKQMKAGIARI